MIAIAQEEKSEEFKWKSQNQQKLSLSQTRQKDQTWLTIRLLQTNQYSHPKRTILVQNVELWLEDNIVSIAKQKSPLKDLQEAQVLQVIGSYSPLISSRISHNKQAFLPPLRTKR